MHKPKPVMIPTLKVNVNVVKQIRNGSQRFKLCSGKVNINRILYDTESERHYGCECGV